MNMMTKLVSACSFIVAGTTIISAQQPPLAPPPVPAAPAAPALPSVSAIGPKIVFQTPDYDFGRVKSGELVKHTFIFTNTGDELLILTNVQPSCGCTTAGEWSHQVEPGKTGTIPIQFNSANYSGQVLKTVTVTCNDKLQPSTQLHVKGTIWKPIDVNPAFAVLNIPPDTQSNVTAKVHVVNNMDELVTLSAPEINNTNTFKATLVTNTPGKDFDVIITAAPPFEQQNYQAQITMKTSSTNAPTISLTAWANVQQAVVVSPPQLMIGAAPLAAKQIHTITVQNNSAKPFKVSDAAVDVKEVDIQMNEPSPGKTFTYTLTFPEGLELKGGKAEFTAKSDNPKFASIRVPISQLARPVAIPANANPQVVPLRPAGIPIAPPSSASTTKPTSVQQ